MDSSAWTPEEVNSYQDTWDGFLAYCREEWLAGRLDITEEQWPCKWCGEAFHSEGKLASHYYKTHQVPPSSFPITPFHYLDCMSMETEWEESREDDSEQPPSPTGMETKARLGRGTKSRDKGFPCKRCQEVFPSIAVLASHFSKVHGESSPRPASAAVSSAISSTTVSPSPSLTAVSSSTSTAFSSFSSSTAVSSSSTSTGISSTSSATASSNTVSSISSFPNVSSASSSIAVSSISSSTAVSTFSFSKPFTATSLGLSHSNRKLPHPQTSKSTKLFRTLPY